MGLSCAQAPTNKKQYISELGKILIKENGKKKFYKPEEVKKAHKKSELLNGLDFSCWGMSTFSSHSDFDRYHKETGELCDYVEMKTEMLNGLSVSSIDEFLPDINIDASWIDFGDFFDGLFTSIFDGM